MRIRPVANAAKPPDSECNKPETGTLCNDTNEEASARLSQRNLPISSSVAQDIIRAVAERLISHYRVLGEIARGGMGVIYRAEDTHLSRHVALKLLSESSLADQESIQRFQREARAASALNHPHIC